MAFTITVDTTTVTVDATNHQVLQVLCNAEHMFALNKFCQVFSGKVFLYRNGFQPFVYRDPLHKPTITQRPHLKLYAANVQ